MPPDDDGRQPAAVDMDTTSTVPKRSRSPSPPSGETHLPDKSCKLARSFASITASSPPRDAITTTSAASESACSLPSQPNRLIIVRSAEGLRSFINPGKVSRAVFDSIFKKKFVSSTLTITGGGRGIKFEVANLDNLAHPPESVTTLGEWSVKCWVASDDDPTYMFGRIFPVSPEMTNDEILAGLTVLDGSPSVIVSALRLPTPVRDGESEANMAIRVKFRGPLPDRVSLDNALYWARAPTPSLSSGAPAASFLAMEPEKPLGQAHSRAFWRTVLLYLSLLHLASLPGLTQFREPLHLGPLPGSFSLVIGNTHSRSYPVTKASHRFSPQSCPLQHLAFRLSLLSMHHALIYADDISLICSAPTIQEAQDHLQRGLDAVHSWTSRWGLTGQHCGRQGGSGGTLPPSPIDMTTDLTDSLTNLQTTCNRHWDNELTDALQYTSLGRIRHDTRHHWWTHSPSRALDTAVTRLRIGHTRLNAHLHKLGMTADPHCPWCPTYPDTPEHLLLQCPRHHSHRTALLQSLSPLLLRRPTLADLLGWLSRPRLGLQNSQTHQDLPTQIGPTAQDLTC
ncbi:hypothetical protein GWK47_023033 [Chionoecetes opilio]|uniref:Reverse transcriptase domain-containing protein n=1 Tax=Chionoecetes opilio TaxID=41210 RepID=A0A8J4XMB9_CHIOP|nr:hypothetical protein GWK47_023033 [Chionoecetes opilio]